MFVNHDTWKRLITRKAEGMLKGLQYESFSITSFRVNDKDESSFCFILEVTNGEYVKQHATYAKVKEMMDELGLEITSNMARTNGNGKLAFYSIYVTIPLKAEKKLEQLLIEEGCQ